MPSSLKILSASFEVKLPQHPLNVGDMTEEQFNAELEKGYADMKAGPVSKRKMPVSECARQSPSGSAAMPRPNGSVFPYFSRFQLRGVCLSRRPRAQRAGDEGGYAALVSFAADLYQDKHTPCCHTRNFSVNKGYIRGYD